MVVEDIPEGWVGPRKGIDPAEKWHSGGNIWLRVAVHPENKLRVVWNPNDSPVKVGVERVERSDDGVWIPQEQLESKKYDSDSDAVTALPEILKEVEREYASCDS
jgi:hypothetical protein